MEEALKKRLIGAVTLVALAVIFVPPLLEHQSHKPVDIPDIQPVPDDLKQDFSSDLINQPVVAPQIPEHILNPPIDPEPELSAELELETQPELQPKSQLAPLPEVVVDAKPTAVEVVPDQPSAAVEKPESKLELAQPQAVTNPAKTPQVSKPVVTEKPLVKRPKVDSNLQAWVIQVASFSQAQNAQKLAKRLRGAGYQVPDVAAVKIKEKSYFRVKVGPMLEKAAAEKLLPKINALSGSKGRVVLHRP